MILLVTSEAFYFHLFILVYFGVMYLFVWADISHFQKLTEESSNEFDFRWNSEPKDIVCAFPYVMAFTPDSVEIRLIINGSLVHTMTMPDLTLITSKVWTN